MSSVSPSFFELVNYTPPDAIFELTKTYNADPVARKVNLGQGTYKDENGNPWILPAVRSAKEKIKHSNHEYLPILGLPSFRTLATDLVFGKHSTAIREGRVSNLYFILRQSPQRLTFVIPPGRILSSSIWYRGTPHRGNNTQAGARSRYNRIYNQA